MAMGFLRSFSAAPLQFCAYTPVFLQIKLLFSQIVERLRIFPSFQVEKCA
jgi:hypothetical protein